MPKPESIPYAGPDPGWGDGVSLRQSFPPLCSPFPNHSAPSMDPTVYAHIPLQGERNTQRKRPDLTDEELLISTPVVMGFSLADKLWRKWYLSLSIVKNAHFTFSGVQRGESSTNTME